MYGTCAEEAMNGGATAEMSRTNTGGVYMLLNGPSLYDGMEVMSDPNA